MLKMLFHNNYSDLLVHTIMEWSIVPAFKIVTPKGNAILQISSANEKTSTGEVLPPRWSDTDWGKSGWIALFSLVGWTTVEVGDSTGQSGRGRVFLTPMSSPWTLTKAS